MMASGAINAMMSGSGPTVFGLFDDEGLQKGDGRYESFWSCKTNLFDFDL